MKLSSIAIAAVLTVAASGCKRGKGEADCKAAANAYATVLRAEVEKGDKSKEKKAQALSLIPTFKDEMIKSCERDKWPAAQRACFATAKVKGDLERCASRSPADVGEAKAPPEGAGAPPAAEGEPAKPEGAAPAAPEGE